MIEVVVKAPSKGGKTTVAQVILQALQKYGVANLKVSDPDLNRNFLRPEKVELAMRNLVASGLSVELATEQTPKPTAPPPSYPPGLYKLRLILAVLSFAEDENDPEPVRIKWVSRDVLVPVAHDGLVLKVGGRGWLLDYTEFDVDRSEYVSVQHLCGCKHTVESLLKDGWQRVCDLRSEDIDRYSALVLEQHGQCVLENVQASLNVDSEDDEEEDEDGDGEGPNLN